MFLLGPQDRKPRTMLKNRVGSIDLHIPVNVLTLNEAVSDFDRSQFNSRGASGSRRKRGHS